MRAVLVHQFGEPEVMKCEEVPNPIPGPGQIRVRIHAAGVNPVDTYIRSGQYPRVPKLPYTPGLDGAGIVDSVGDGVTGISPGLRVYIHGSLTGTYAEFTLCEPHQVFPLPDRITFSQGAAIGVPFSTAYRALYQIGRARPGERVFIHGASGGVGTAAIQLGCARGLFIIGTAGTPRGLELVRKHGAQHALNHNEAESYEKLLDLTEGHGFDLIIEMLANVNLGRDLKFLARGGRVVVVGSRGIVQIDPRDAMARDATIHGMSLFNATATDLQEIHAALYAGLEQGTLNPVVGMELPLEEAPRAHRQVLTLGSYGKIVLRPDRHPRGAA